MYSLLWLHLYISLQLLVLPCHVQKVIIKKKKTKKKKTNKKKKVFTPFSISEAMYGNCFFTVYKCSFSDSPKTENALVSVSPLIALSQLVQETRWCMQSI